MKIKLAVSEAVSAQFLAEQIRKQTEEHEQIKTAFQASIRQLEQERDEARSMVSKLQQERAAFKARTERMVRKAVHRFDMPIKAAYKTQEKNKLAQQQVIEDLQSELAVMHAQHTANLNQQSDLADALEAEGERYDALAARLTQAEDKGSQAKARVAHLEARLAKQVADTSSLKAAHAAQLSNVLKSCAAQVAEQKRIAAVVSTLHQVAEAEADAAKAKVDALQKRIQHLEAPSQASSGSEGSQPTQAAVQPSHEVQPIRERSPSMPIVVTPPHPEPEPTPVVAAQRPVTQQPAAAMPGVQVMDSSAGGDDTRRGDEQGNQVEGLRKRSRESDSEAEDGSGQATHKRVRVEQQPAGSEAAAPKVPTSGAAGRRWGQGSAGRKPSTGGAGSQCSAGGAANSRPRWQ